MMEAFALAAAVLTVQQFYYGRFVEGVEATVFAGGSELLADSAAGTGRLADLSAGTPVTILADGGDWCRVDAGGTSGWVESGDLALVSLATSGGLFQLGVTGVDDSGEPAGEARLLRDDDTVLSCPVDLRHFSEDGRVNYCVQASESPSEGLSGAVAAVVLSFVYEACGYLNSDILLVVTGDELVPGPEAESVSEAGIFRHASSIVLPAALGEEDVVAVITTDTEWGWTGDSAWVSAADSSMFRYAWNGRFFDLEP